jgi:predicted NBD/HSP70 family sugar kinase
MSNKPAEKTDVQANALAEHGAAILPRVRVDDYSAEIRDADGYVGDRASNRAFRDILAEWRKRLGELDIETPDDEPIEKLSKKKLDRLLADGDAKLAGMLHSAIEDFAQALAAATRRFLRLKAWAGTERIVVGGGFSDSRIGEVVIGRTSALLESEKHGVVLTPIRHHPDEAGLIGAVQLAPSWIFAGHDAILAVDIGGTNIRAGIVELNVKAAKDLAKAEVSRSDLWRHAEDKPKRNEAIDRLVSMLKHLAKSAERDKLRLAPFIGVGCPGTIESDGSITGGSQNLPGNWEGKGFNLPQRLREAIPAIGEHQTAIVMHNDAVLQGLSEAPFMREVKHWAVLTIGTGLGNARFTNR